MVTAIRVYFEGDKALREGFGEFFRSIRELARASRIRFDLVNCGTTAVRNFMIAMRTHRESFNILLIDSDSPDNGNLIVTKVKQHAHWDSGVGATVTDDQIHFMVQVMETWFLAEPTVLEGYYGERFVTNRLPPNPQIEQIPKDDVTLGIQQATRQTRKGRYHKTQHAPDILARINVSTVRSVAPSCERLFVVLERLVS